MPRRLYLYIGTLLILLFFLGLPKCFGAMGEDWDYNPYAPAIEKTAIAGAADLITTAVALGSAGVEEANPMFTFFGSSTTAVLLSAVVVKGAFLAVLPMLEEKEQVVASDIMSGVQWGAAANNVMILAGASGAAVPVGILTGLYLILCDFDKLPDAMCIF